MVLHNPNNWHWVNKDAAPWARQWFEDSLCVLAAEQGDAKARISKVVSADGDVDVSQRKGKVITIYDVKLVLEYSGSAPGEEDVSGTITIPEVAHDTEENEFVFEIDVYSDSPGKQPVKDLVRAGLVPQLRATLIKLAGELVAAHAKDIQHAPGANPSSGFTPAKVYSSSSVNRAAAAGAAPVTSSAPGSVNTTTVSAQEEFRTTAAQLYETFTDAQRVAAFTRAAPKVWEGAEPGAKFEIFDGNVAGSFEELAAPTTIVQKWRLQQWPAGHYSTLRIEFDQNDVDAVTVMRVAWSGVPVGQEDVTRRNWDEYYVRSIKRTFGFGTIL